MSTSLPSPVRPRLPPIACSAGVGVELGGGRELQHQVRRWRVPASNIAGVAAVTGPYSFVKTAGPARLGDHRSRLTLRRTATEAFACRSLSGNRHRPAWVHPSPRAQGHCARHQGPGGRPNRQRATVAGKGGTVERPLAIEAEGLQKRFGDVKALAGVDLHAPAGGVLGLLGPNGAGKTTAVRILTTLLEPDQGSARVAGFDVMQEPARVRARIGPPASTRRSTRT